jgi:hypothetical protein
VKEWLRVPARWSVSTTGSRQRSPSWKLDRGTAEGYWR